MAADEALTPEALAALTREDTIEVPPQIEYGISIFQMQDGPPIVHFTPGPGTEASAVPVSELITLLRTAVDNLQYRQFMERLAQESIHASQQRRMGKQGG